jgi:RNase P/RNase MRP subunit POP5
MKIKALNLSSCEIGMRFVHSDGSECVFTDYDEDRKQIEYEIDDRKYTTYSVSYEEYVDVIEADFEESVIKKIKKVFGYLVSIEKFKDDESVFVVLRTFSSIYGDVFTEISLDPKPWLGSYEFKL